MTPNARVGFGYVSSLKYSVARPSSPRGTVSSTRLKIVARTVSSSSAASGRGGRAIAIDPDAVDPAVDVQLEHAGALDRGIKFRAMMLPDTFIDQDSPNAMYAKAGLDARGIVTKVFEALGKDAGAERVKLA